MDRIEKLLKEIKGDRGIWEHQGKRIEYGGAFLNRVGEIFEKYGFGATKIYLVNQTERGRYHEIRAKCLKRVIEKMEQYPEITGHRAIGRYVIKMIGTLKTGEV